MASSAQTIQHAARASERPSGSPRKSRKLVFLLVFAVLASTAVGVYFVVRLPREYRTAKSTVSWNGWSETYSRATVATEAGICSTIGRDMLLAGGNAVDAAIASLLCLGVVNSFSSGIGGGGFFVIRLANGTSVVVDFRETALVASTRDMFAKTPNATMLGALAVGIPGEIRGFAEAHRRYGRLPWGDLFAPSVALARTGFRVTAELAARIKKFELVIRENEGLAQTYLRNGSLYQEGDVLRRENLAATLEKIADGGPDVFYRGEVARKIVAGLKKHGGIITMRDLAAYRPVFRAPLEGMYRGRKVLTAGIPARYPSKPKSSGAVALEILHILDHFDLRRKTADSIHIFIEALKHGYASRGVLADPTGPHRDTLLAFQTKIISPVFAAMRARLISNTYPPDHYGVRFEEHDDHGTTHASVLDADGMAVSCISTINLQFGSKLVDMETGILFNSQMDDFSLPFRSNYFALPPNPRNFIGKPSVDLLTILAPRKRPASSGTPLIVLAKNSTDVEIVVGAAGGSRIISATIQTVVNLLDHGMSAADSIQSMRVHHQYKPDFVELEHGADARLAADLESRGHTIKHVEQGLFLSAVQMIYRNPQTGLIEAVSDLRKRGAPDGYAHADAA